MAKTTLRVYDSGKKGYVDRYTLYTPMPKKNSQIKGFCWDFSFNDTDIITCCHTDIEHGTPIRVLGKKVDIKTLPQHVQDWIAKEQKTWDEDLKNY